ncbi:MAG: UDP-N-acetylglucosamine 2-epimerase (non-hydrolyzing) [Alphaproteobacteria bacterium]|nr:UDP-N-acetylglucosamine 2-epimerase (non-hydrolyzing) [Alphaproteobacteria bacterium]
MKTILFIFGTRPEVIKIFPIIKVLKCFPNDYNVILCNTGQQKELSAQALDMFNIGADYNLSVMKENQSLEETQNTILSKLSQLLNNIKTDAIIVQGDTLSAFCGALSGFYKKIPVFHVEAGLRTNDIREPFPEESYRKMISCIATLHFAPSNFSKKNLLEENICKKNIYVTGNTIVDTLKFMDDYFSENAIKKLKNKGIDFQSKNILITTHRRENQDEKLISILNAIKKLSEENVDHNFIIPVHPNPNFKNVIYNKLSNIKNIKLFQPLDYDELICLMKKCCLIMTDSGGIQEEASSLGIPLVIMRNKTERQEVLKLPNVKLVGTNMETIYEKSRNLLEKQHKITSKNNLKTIYGCGTASIKIEKIIRNFFN